MRLIDSFFIFYQHISNTINEKLSTQFLNIFILINTILLLTIKSQHNLNLFINTIPPPPQKKKRGAHAFFSKSILKNFFTTKNTFQNQRFSLQKLFTIVSLNISRINFYESKAKNDKKMKFSLKEFSGWKFSRWTKSYF